MAKKSRQREVFENLSIPWKYDYEDLEEFDHQPEEEDEFNLPNPHQAILKYLKQVRSSFGFDVDCRPPSWYEDATYIPIDMEYVKLKDVSLYNAAIKASQTAIREINEETGKTYEIVELEKAVITINFEHLSTISVRVAGDADAGVTTIQSVVYEDIGDAFSLEEWRFKPVTLTEADAATASTPVVATSPADALTAADAATASTPVVATSPADATKASTPADAAPQ